MTNEQKLIEIQQRIPTIQENIQSKLQDLDKEFNSLSKQSAESVDSLDKAKFTDDQAIILARHNALNNESLRIKKVTEAIKDDSYGYCLGCGFPIEIERMESQPLTTHCTPCKNVDEYKQRH